jgi:hypothetical protein
VAGALFGLCWEGARWAAQSFHRIVQPQAPWGLVLGYKSIRAKPANLQIQNLQMMKVNCIGNEILIHTSKVVVSQFSITVKNTRETIHL